MLRDDSVSAQPVLLGLLMLGPRHPYELHQEFKRELGRIWLLGQAQLYAHLKQLAQAELVTAQTELQPNRPPRNVYQLTPAGREAFHQWLHQPVPHIRHVRLEFMARLYFFQRLSLPGLEELVQSEKALLQPRVTSLREAAAKTDDAFWKMVLEYRLTETEAVILWLDRCLEIAPKP